MVLGQAEVCSPVATIGVIDCEPPSQQQPERATLPRPGSRCPWSDLPVESARAWSMRAPHTAQRAVEREELRPRFVDELPPILGEDPCHKLILPGGVKGAGTTTCPSLQRICCCVISDGPTKRRSLASHRNGLGGQRLQLRRSCLRTRPRNAGGGGTRGRCMTLVNLGGQRCHDTVVVTATPIFLITCPVKAFDWFWVLAEATGVLGAEGILFLRSGRQTRDPYMFEDMGGVPFETKFGLPTMSGLRDSRRHEYTRLAQTPAADQTRHTSSGNTPPK